MVTAIFRMKLYYVYVLQSLKDDKLYIGYTEDWLKRLDEHNSGINVATKNRVPFKIIYLEAFISKREALVKEKFYKSGRGHEVLYKMLFVTLGHKNGKVAKVVTARV